jgi:hypothetical protein
MPIAWGELEKLVENLGPVALEKGGPLTSEIIARMDAAGVTAADVQACIEKFVAANVPTDASEADRVAAQGAGLVSAFGEFSIQFGMSKGRPGSAIAAAARMFAAAQKR